MGRMSDVEIDVRTVRGTIEVIVHALARVVVPEEGEDGRSCGSYARSYPGGFSAREGRSPHERNPFRSP